MRPQVFQNPVVVIFCHSRAALLETAIQSFIAAEDSENWFLVVVQQLGYQEVDLMLQKYSEEIDYLHTFSPISDHYLANINHSRLTGWEIAFTNFCSSFVIGIEEDTSIAGDLLIFSNFIFRKHGTHPRFRGINYTSFYSFNQDLLHTYTLRRFGLSGQCGGLPRNTWKKFNLASLRKLGSEEEWASHIEPLMKTGFTVFPNQSRALDQGWGGTSNPSSTSTEDYFIRHKQSWVGSHACQENFIRFDLREEIWRNDAILYNPLHNLYFSLRKYKSIQNIYHLLRKIGFPNIKTMIHGSN